MNAIVENKSQDSKLNQTPTQTVGSWLAGQLEAVKRQVFNEYQEALGANQHLLRLALFEADVLARQTGYPQLLFPALAAEKAQNAARWQFRQQYLLRSNSPYALAA